MEFDSIKMFIEVVRDLTIFHGRDLKWVKVDNIQARARCKQVGCSWEIYCSWSEVTRSFQINTFLEEHIYGRVFKNKQATMKWMEKRVVDKLRFHPNLNHVEPHEHFREHYSVQIDERKMFKAIKEA